MSDRWSNAQALVQEAEERSRASSSEGAHADLAGVVQELCSDYDFLGMDRVVAIEPWGRSGSILLGSYFDGHEDVLALPALRSNGLYVFFDTYPTLSLREKLIAYPLFDEYYDPHSDAAGCGRSLFEGPFSIGSREYRMAALAVCEAYQSLPPAFAGSAKGFFIAVHVAFNRALGRRPRSSRPLIVCAQHERDNPMGTHLIEDFREARFIQTVRDPVSSVDRLFAWFFDPKLLPDRQPTKAERAERGEAAPAHYASILASWMVLHLSIAADRPHQGAEDRTRVIRFEDMHQRTHQTMHELADWLGLAASATLTESTLAGKPYVVAKDGKAWSGPRREKLKRESRNLARRDRALLYGLFHGNFVAWGYPYPKVFDYRLARLAGVAVAAVVPTRMEMIVARTAWQRRIWPSLKRGRWRILADTVGRIVYSRLAIASLAIREIPRRVIRRRSPIQVGGAVESPFNEPMPESKG